MRVDMAKGGCAQVYQRIAEEGKKLAANRANLTNQEFDSCLFAKIRGLNSLDICSEPDQRGELLASGAEKTSTRAWLSSGLERSDRN